MWYLIAAISCSSAMLLTLRYAGKREKNNYVTLATNYAVSATLCFLTMSDKRILPDTDDRQTVLFIGMISGILYTVALMLNRLNIKKNGTPMTASFSHLGVLIPTVLSIVIFGEQPSMKQWVGIALAIVAILIINISPRKEQKIAFPTGLFLLFLLGGSSDMMTKVFEHQKIPHYDRLFLFYAFGTAFLVCITLNCIKRQKSALKDCLYGAILGVFNFGATLLLLQAVMRLPAFLVYPVFSVGVIILVNLVNHFFLKESISKRQYVGMAIICVALLFL